MSASRRRLPWNGQKNRMQKQKDCDFLRYLPLGDVLKSADECFGKDSWSSEQRSQKILRVERQRDGSYNVMVQAVVRVTVSPQDGDPFWREDIGIGLVQGVANELRATALAIKWASTDGLKRALRLFSEMFFSGEDGEESRGDRDGFSQNATASSVSFESGGGDASPEARVRISFKPGKQGRKRPGSPLVSRRQLDLSEMFSSALMQRRCSTGPGGTAKNGSIVCLDSEAESVLSGEQSDKGEEEEL